VYFICQCIIDYFSICCCRFVSVHSTQSDALRLVMVLTKHGLCRLDAADVWSLFDSTAIRPTAASLCFLATFLDRNGAPEQGQNSAAAVKKSKKSVRSQLMNWLICCRTDVSDDEFIPAMTHVDTKLLSEILVALTVRDAHVSHKCVCSNVVQSVAVFSDIERMCLLSQFHSAIQLPLCVSSTTAGRRQVPHVSESSVLYCRQHELLACLSADIDYSLTYAKPEVRIMHL